ncbi:MAG: 2-C-methyl-D-erythritol 2,4-cyclodiphosphate synthase [Spirochaetota bacterium]|nr:2-C-methyl-D-erythritol 2,4-cyclodiphosphate synthase [Spirochaetota bacterium]
MRVGTGYDVHPFIENRDLIIGGEKFDYIYGLAGHSDADVLIHAIIDSILGAANLGDIGLLFPDSDIKYKNISSINLLKNVNKILIEKNIEILNIDSIIICEEPKIAGYVNNMKMNISDALNGFPVDRIGIKGKTTERLGFAGRGEGIAASAVSLLYL